MTRVLLALVLVVAFACSVGATTREPTRYNATVRCEHVAEDTVARVTLTRYVVRDNGTRVLGYRCT